MTRKQLTRKQLTLEILAAGVAVLLPTSFVQAQSCDCQRTGSPGDRASTYPEFSYLGGPYPENEFFNNVPGSYVSGRDYGGAGSRGFYEQPAASSAPRLSSQLPPGWPQQWPGPADSSDSSSKESVAAAPSIETRGSAKSAVSSVDTSKSAARSAAGDPGKNSVGATAAGPKNSMVRDPFSGLMVPTAAQPRWDRPVDSSDRSKTQTAMSERSADPEKARSGVSTQVAVETADKNTTAVGAAETKVSSDSAARFGNDPSGKAWSILPSRNGAGGGSGAAIGGGIGSGGMSGGGGSGGEIGGGSGGGGVGGNSGGSSWNPKAAGSGGGGSSGGTSTGVNSYVSSNDGPNDGLVDVPLPDPEIPDITPDVPGSNAPLNFGGGIIPGGNGQDSPVVPEPGSIILLGIAGGVGGAGWVRRRLKKTKATES